MPTDKAHTNFTTALLESSQHLSKEIIKLHRYGLPQNIIAYNVLEYAWEAWKHYIQQFARPSTRTLILGINPGPHGMVQTGVPFGNISTVTKWLKLDSKISMPATMHPKRPVRGMDYTREEPSGALLWKCMQNIFETPENFFKQYFVLNYCPVAYFLREDSKADGCNLTPDKLSKEYRSKIEALCTKHLSDYIRLFEIEIIFAIGKYSAKKAEQILQVLYQTKENLPISIHYITHPSPLNPKHKEFPREFEALHRDLYK